MLPRRLAGFGARPCCPVAITTTEHPLRACDGTREADVPVDRSDHLPRLWSRSQWRSIEPERTSASSKYSSKHNSWKRLAGGAAVGTALAGGLLLSGSVPSLCQRGTGRCERKSYRAGKGRLLVGQLQRNGVRLRRRCYLRGHGWEAPQCADCRDSGRSRRQRLLASGQGRRGVRLRLGTLLQLIAWTSPPGKRADRGDGDSFGGCRAWRDRPGRASRAPWSYGGHWNYGPAGTWWRRRLRTSRACRGNGFSWASRACGRNRRQMGR